MKAKQYGKRVTKWDIAVMIENLPGNTAWGANSNMTIIYNEFTIQELAEKYNDLVKSRNLPFEKIEIS